MTDENYELPSRRKKVMDGLAKYEDDSFLMSTLPKKEKKQKPVEEESDVSEWITSLSTISASSIRLKGNADILLNPNKKKKKKNKHGVDLKDYNKEFETEMGLLDNLILEQSRFTQSLQQKFDSVNNTKTAVRGTGKFTTDLIAGVTSARALYANLVKDKINAKKLINDYELKQKKEMGIGAEGTEDMNQYTASLLKNIMSNRSEILNPDGTTMSITDVTETDIINHISGVELDDDIGDETMQYLINEDRNVRVYAIINHNDYSDYYFSARADDGMIIHEYPLPDVMGGSAFNESTMILTDRYGEKYPCIFDERSNVY